MFRRRSKQAPPPRLAWRALFARLDPVAPCARAEVARVAGGVDRSGSRVRLPDALATCLVQDEGGRRFVVSVLDEKGVRWDFDPSVTPRVREAVLEGWLRHLEGWPALLEAGLPEADVYGGEDGAGPPAAGGAWRVGTSPRSPRRATRRRPSGCWDESPQSVGS